MTDESGPKRLARRAFVAGSVATLASACTTTAGPAGAPNAAAAPLPPPEKTRAEMPRRPLGQTGEMVSAIGVGGFHLGKPSEREAIRIVRTAIDRGVNFLDNCWDYNGGESERRMGLALRTGYRDKVFLMTKIDGRTKEAAAGQINQSLKRLRTDHIDLVQIHEVIRGDDPMRVFAEGGALEALVDAQKAGKLRFIGFTGHKDPLIHNEMLDEADAHGFRFDTVQMPLNVMDAHYRSFEKDVLPRAVEKGMGVLGMKCMGSGIILQSKTVTARECLRYALSLPTSVVITGCDSLGVLGQAIEAAVAFEPLSDEEKRALLDRTKIAAADGRYEKFKTSDRFDGTAHHPEWLERAKI
jgi:aryl-alcohol dehydrogenase-like predicted oxidoreductase